MLRAVLAAALLGLAGLCVERAAAWCGLPRRWAWAAALATSVLLPLLSLWMPDALPGAAIPIGLGAGDGAAAGALPAAVGPASGSARFTLPPLRVVLPVLWMALSAAWVASLAVGYARLRRVRERSPGAWADGVPVRVADTAGPAVVGLLHPAIVLPRWAMEAPPEERGLIVRHEQEHVRAGDAWLLAVSALAVAAMPWSPGLWWQHRRLRLAVETDCDARVLRAGADLREYGRVLLGAASREPFPMLPVPSWTAAASHLEHRIVTMSASRPKHPLARAVSATGVGLALALGACAVSSPSPSVPQPERVVTEGGWSSLRREPKPGEEVIEVEMKAEPSTRPTPGFLPYFDVNLIGPHAYHPGERWPVYPQVRGIKQGSAVQRAGLMLGDTVLTVNGRDMREWDVFHDAQVGTVYTLHVRRAGQERDITFAIEPDAPAPGRR
jgi:hypothetical protein